MMVGVPDTRTIRWAPALAAALKAGLPLTVVGRQGAPSPLSSVVVLARSGGDSCSLATIFLPTIERGALAMSPIGPGRVVGFDPARTVGARFPTRRRGSGVYVLAEDGAEQFVVAPGLFNQPTLSAGSRPLLLPLVGPHTPARPLAAGEAAPDPYCAPL